MSVSDNSGSIEERYETYLSELNITIIYRNRKQRYILSQMLMKSFLKKEKRKERKREKKSLSSSEEQKKEKKLFLALGSWQ